MQVQYPTSFDVKDIMTMDDGRIGEAVRQKLKQILDDCEDRPAVNKPRRVQIQLFVTPVMDQHGNLDNVKIGFHVDTKFPAQQSREYQMLYKGGSLLFNELSPENPSQATIPVGDNDGEKEKGSEK